jgi:hypothetical protein
MPPTEGERRRCYVAAWCNCSIGRKLHLRRRGLRPRRPQPLPMLPKHPYRARSRLSKALWSASGASLASARSVALKMDRLQIIPSAEGDGLMLMMGATKEELKNMPTFKSKKEQGTEKQAAERPRNTPATTPLPKNSLQQQLDDSLARRFGLEVRPSRVLCCYEICPTDVSRVHQRSTQEGNFFPLIAS